MLDWLSWASFLTWLEEGDNGQILDLLGIAAGKKALGHLKYVFEFLYRGKTIKHVYCSANDRLESLFIQKRNLNLLIFKFMSAL